MSFQHKTWLFATKWNSCKQNYFNPSAMVAVAATVTANNKSCCRTHREFFLLLSYEKYFIHSGQNTHILWQIRSYQIITYVFMCISVLVYVVFKNVVDDDNNNNNNNYYQCFSMTIMTMLITTPNVSNAKETAHANNQTK